MNCLEARRRLLVDPSRPGREAREHLSACAACAHESDRLLRLDEAIRGALRVEPAPEMDARILLAQVLRRRPAWVGREVMAVAAALLLSLGVAIWTLWVPGAGAPQAGSSLSAAVLDHIRSEIGHLQRDEEVPPQALVSMLSSFGATLQEDLGAVRFMSRCRIRKTDGMHLVLNGVRGPITVLLMPEEQMLQVEAVDGTRFHGLVVPAGRGSMAVVGEKAEPLGNLVEKLDRAVVWES